MINKTKFQNYFLHYLAVERVSKIAKKYKKTELYQSLKAVRLENARQDLSKISDLRDLRDWRDLLDLRDWRDWRDLRDLHDWRDWQTNRVKALVSAYIYAGGKKSDLIEKKLNTKLLLDIDTQKWALDQSNWHSENTCGTTHCTAGGTIVILDKVGFELEKLVGTPTAASVISFVSTGSIPNYYELDDNIALKDIQARAEEEPS